MNREDYQKIKQIFQSALDIPSEKRGEFLADICKNDRKLLGEVQKLLNSYETDYLEQPAIERMAGEFVSKDLEPGQVIGHYHILRKIGAGGMGEIYLAEDTKLDRKVALKILSDKISGDADRFNRFIQEAKSASALNHPNIITVFEIGESGGNNYISTELIKGDTLRERMKKRLTIDEMLSILIQTAEALSAAHQVGIIHRDIKPENIMIRADGYVKVVDFG